MINSPQKRPYASRSSTYNTPISSNIKIPTYRKFVIVHLSTYFFVRRWFSGSRRNVWCDVLGSQAQYFIIEGLRSFSWHFERNGIETEHINSPSSIVLILKSIPMVEINVGLNALSANRNIMQVLPTPLSPMRRSLKNKSKFFAIFTAHCVTLLLQISLKGAVTSHETSTGTGKWEK